MAAAGSQPVNLHWEPGKLTGGLELCHCGGNKLVRLEVNTPLQTRARADESFCLARWVGFGEAGGGLG